MDYGAKNPGPRDDGGPMKAEADFERIYSRIVALTSHVAESMSRVRAIADGLYGVEPPPPTSPGAGSMLSTGQEPHYGRVIGAFTAMENDLDALRNQINRLRRLV